MFGCFRNCCAVEHLHPFPRALPTFSQNLVSLAGLNPALVSSFTTKFGLWWGMQPFPSGPFANLKGERTSPTIKECCGDKS